jgi:hypothetical protein
VVQVNGDAQPVEAAAGQFIKIDRAWNGGDTIQLKLPMKVAFRKWTKNHNSVSVDRGPLTYSLEIGEKYVQQGGTEDWPAWEIHPTSPWNYGLELDGKQLDRSYHEVVSRPWPDDDMPWTHQGTPLKLKLRGRRIPSWTLDQYGLVAPLQDSPVRSEEPIESISLIPMGAARLRISAFPVIGTGPEASPWRAEPKQQPAESRGEG